MIGANTSLGSSSYIVTFNVPSVTISSLEIDGGIAGGEFHHPGAAARGNVLTIQGVVTFVANEAEAL